MKIIVLESDQNEAKLFEGLIKEVCIGSDVKTFSKASSVLASLNEATCDVAFVGLDDPELDVGAFAYELQKNNSKVNIIFITARSEVELSALSVYPSGVVQKPLTYDKIQSEILHLRHPNLKRKCEPKLYVKCFGNFEVKTPNGETLHFDRVRSKELFAYLVYRNGASCTTQEMFAVLFDDRNCDKSSKVYLQNIISSMQNTLRAVNAEDVITRGYGYLQIDPEKLKCDWYDFSNGDISALNNYNGEFMAQYSWAENVNGFLYSRMQQRKKT